MNMNKLKKILIKHKKSALCLNIFISTLVGSYVGVVLQQISYGLVVSLMLNITISTLLAKKEA